uniref:Uncharacterized protein n=1 Tax=Ditylenchus dipsaci TaxID=166011 RepID=A0A915EUC6_9BILA
MTETVAAVLDEARGVMDTEFKSEMLENIFCRCLRSAQWSLSRSASFSGCWSNYRFCCFRKIRPPSLDCAEFGSQVEIAHRKHWHEPRSTDDELKHFISNEWHTRGKNELEENVFSDDEIFGDNTVLFFMPFVNHPLLNDVIKKAAENGCLQNSFFVAHNYFLREENSDSDDDDDEEEEDQTNEASTVNHLCQQPHLTSFLAECKFVPLPGFGGALSKHALLYSDKERRFFYNRARVLRRFKRLSLTSNLFWNLMNHRATRRCIQISFHIPSKLENLESQVAELQSEVAGLKQKVSKQHLTIKRLKQKITKQQLTIRELKRNARRGP